MGTMETVLLNTFLSFVSLALQYRITIIIRVLQANFGKQRKIKSRSNMRLTHNPKNILTFTFSHLANAYSEQLTLSTGTFPRVK